MTSPGAENTRAPLPAIVLAGERPGGNALAREHGVAAGVLVEVAGRPCIARVIDALRASRAVRGGVVVGPDPAVLGNAPALTALFAPGDFRWLAPAAGPSASALAGLAALDTAPVLLTAGDHALLEPAVVDEFCAAALASPCDFVVGLVPHAIVAKCFPQSRRTVLRLRDGAWCGSNLFLVRTRAGARALELWRALERDRKRPWRMAARLGPRTLLAWLTGRLTTDGAFARLSALAGCRAGMCAVPHARAAVDVDSSADRALAEEVLSRE